MPPIRASATVRAALLSLLLLVSAADGASAQSSADAELRRTTAQLLSRLEELSGLEARRPVNVARRSRAELRAYIGRAMEEAEASGELRAGETVYKRLGLLPDTLDLKRTYAAFLGEQIAGYYDPRRDTLYVLDDVPASILRPVLAHEIVHALQAQHIPMDSLMSARGADDRRAAAHALIEGQAMLVMMLFTVQEHTGRVPPLDELPELSHVSLDMSLPYDEYPAFATAPRIIREGFVFPYTRGAGFMQAVGLRGHPWETLRDLLPASTEQVMDPEGRFLGERDEPTELMLEGLAPASEGATTAGADPGEAVGRWAKVYENTLGQFELSVLLQERDPRVGAERYARGWDGDRYALLSDGERHAVLWYVLWDDRASAFHFAQAYRQFSHARLGRTVTVEEMDVDGRPVVRIVEAEPGVDPESLPRPTVRLAAERD